MIDEPEDRMGVTDEQWAKFQAYTHGYGEQDAYGIDISLLRENLRRTPTQRLQKLLRALEIYEEIRSAGMAARLRESATRGR